MGELTVVYWSLADGELWRSHDDHVPQVGETITLGTDLPHARVLQRDFAPGADGSMELLVQVELSSSSTARRWWRRGK